MILTTIAIVAQATPAAAASTAPAPTPTPNAAMLANAQAWFASLQKGKIYDATALDAQMTSLMTPDTMKKIETSFAPLGPPTKFEQIQAGVQAGTTFYVYQLTFKTGDVFDFLYALDASGKISGLRLGHPQ